MNEQYYFFMASWLLKKSFRILIKLFSLLEEIEIVFVFERIKELHINLL
jgi:hypothetical protein